GENRHERQRRRNTGHAGLVAARCDRRAAALRVSCSADGLYVEMIEIDARTSATLGGKPVDSHLGGRSSGGALRMRGDDDEPVRSPMIKKLLVVGDTEQRPIGPADDGVPAAVRAEGDRSENIVSCVGTRVVVALGREGSVGTIVGYWGPIS